MANREGWLESKIQISEELGRRLREVAVARGWSLDTCARLALLAAARKARIDLQGGDEPEVMRRTKETMLEGSSDRIWITFPKAWKPGLDLLVEQSEIHTKLAPLWREAMLRWLSSEERTLAREKAVADAEGEAA